MFKFSMDKLAYDVAIAVLQKLAAGVETLPSTPQELGFAKQIGKLSDGVLRNTMKFPDFLNKANELMPQVGPKGSEAWNMANKTMSSVESKFGDATNAAKSVGGAAKDAVKTMSNPGSSWGTMAKNTMDFGKNIWGAGKELARDGAGLALPALKAGARGLGTVAGAAAGTLAFPAAAGAAGLMLNPEKMEAGSLANNAAAAKNMTDKLKTPGSFMAYTDKPVAITPRYLVPGNNAGLSPTSAAWAKSNPMLAQMTPTIGKPGTGMATGTPAPPALKK